MGRLNDLDVVAAAGINVAAPATKLHISRTELLDFFLSLFCVFHLFLQYGLQLKLHDLVKGRENNQLESVYEHNSASFATWGSKTTYSLGVFLIT